MIINTLEQTKMLQDRGFSQEQSEAVVQMVATIVDDNLATKTDLNDLRKDVAHLMEMTEQKNAHRLAQLEQHMIIKLGAMSVVAIGIVATLVKIL